MPRRSASRRRGRVACAAVLALLVGATALPESVPSDSAGNTAGVSAPGSDDTPPPAPVVGTMTQSPAPDGASTAAKSSWFDPSKLPFIPVPLIGVDPNSGTTVGVIPTWVHTNDEQQITRIVAPDLVYNPSFGPGAHFRLFAYPSLDMQWSVVAYYYEHVQRSVDYEFESGRLRNGPWSITASLVDTRDGTPRFYGIGNESPAIDETDYTSQEARAQTQIGYNLNHAWQLQYTLRERVVDVLPGSLAGIAALQTRFGNILGVGTNDQLLNRLSVVYDTRNDPTIPSNGVKWVAYGGFASRHGVFNDSMYSETGIDGRAFWPVAEATIVATHLALRYLPTSEQVPFWALSSIGGGDSLIGGPQPLRGYGEGRYYDRDYFSSTIEVRRRVLDFNAISTHVEVEVTPFVDLGRVFARSGTFPLEQLHQVYGIGFRGIARPSVVGYVDIGIGNSGVAAFTGISYPF
jgi:hypothetical protein